VKVIGENMKIIADVMGSDKGARELVKGACDALREYANVESLIIVGNENEIKEALGESGADMEKIEIVHTDEIINMCDDPLCVNRSKAASSMSTGLRMLAEGKGDAFVSAGNTGALFAGATLIVRKIKGVNRPAIATVLPMDPPVLLLDSGANINVTPQYLEQFALCGSEYMKNMYGVNSPRGGLLNNGAEKIKGTELQSDTYKVLSENEGINFIGNVEGNGVARNKCDVLVTDGFTGNILLKSIEGMGKLMMSLLKEIFGANIGTKLA
jgi:glycerol-3-phosphate acyltransferase PlsX